MRAAHRVRQRRRRAAPSAARQEDEVDLGGGEVRRQAAMQLRRGVAQLAHVAEHGDAPAADAVGSVPSTSSAARIEAGLAL